MNFLTLSQAIGTLIALLLLHNLWRSKTKTNNHVRAKLAPEPKGAWPIIGHLRLLGAGGAPLHRTLSAMADAQGPIFTIQLGKHRALVVSSKETIMDCFTTNDLAFLSRPTQTTALKHMGYDGAMSVLGPHGVYWRELRKIMSHELLSNSRLELLKPVRASEVSSCIKYLYSLCSTNRSLGVPERLDNYTENGVGGIVGATNVNMSRLFRLVTFNVMLRTLAGRRYCLSSDEGRDDQAEANRFTRAMDEFMYLLGAFEFSDMIPFVRDWMDLSGHVKSMKRAAKETDHFMSRWLEEHIQSRRENGQMMRDVDRDFMDVLLSLFPGDGDQEYYGYKSKNVIKGTIMSLFTGGSDTTTATMTWGLSLLLNHTKSLQILQQELDTHVGREKWVEESDVKNLVYLQAFIKETLRLYPPGPLAFREATEDCHVAGYLVPKGTRLIVNTWKLHRDSRVWADPSEFRPERFLGRGNEFDFLPFGYGRRMCPGVTAAFQMMHLTLGRLLQGFNFATPTNEPIDMSEGIGITTPKATPLEVLISPRLSPELYQQ